MRRLLALAILLLSAVAAAQGFVRTHVPEKNLCLFWPDRKYVYHLNDKGSAQTPGQTEFGAADAAFQTWNALALTCSDYRFSRGADTVSRVVEYRQGATDNENVILWRESNCRDVVAFDDPCHTDDSCGDVHDCWDHGDQTIALTTTTFSLKYAYIYDADIELNASPHLDGPAFLFTTVNSPQCQPDALSTSCVASDVQNTLTHEIGHVIGLDHSLVEGSTMEATAPIGETKKRVLDPGTAEGFCTIYPKGAPTPACDDTGVVVKRIVGESTGTSGLSVCSVEPGGPMIALGLLALLRRRRRSR